MKLLIMSDIHGNLNALEEILKAAGNHNMDSCLLLGDLIDYGMRSNEVITRLQKLDVPLACNIWGNHEQAIVSEEYRRFSSDRGRKSAMNTRRNLSEQAWAYLAVMESAGKKEFVCGEKKCLAIHGSLEDVYWGTIQPDQDLFCYGGYDYVFSGHSHRPHYYEKYFETEDPVRRNKKKTIFINPGSVGQPRNLNSMAQAALLDTETEEIHFLKVAYDIKGEQDAFDGQTDSFYQRRLEYGV